MDGPDDSLAEDVTRLRNCVSDLDRIMALPALRTGGEPAEIVEALLDALLGTLRLGFVCVRLNAPEHPPSSTTIRVADSMHGTADAQEIAQAMDSLLGQALPTTSRTHPHVFIRDIGLAVACVPIGICGDVGVVAAGCRRSDFPTPLEGLVLDVAVSLAAIGLQQALLNGQRDSARESRLIVENAPGLIALLRADGGVESVNRQILDYSGRTLEELKEWGTGDIVHVEDLPHVIEVFTRSVISGGPYDIMQRLRRADGVYRWFQNSGRPLRDAAGHVVRWCVLLTDVDDAKRSEEAVRANERNLQLIIDTMPALAWSARTDGTAEFFNEHYLRFIGMSANEASDWGWTVAVHPEDVNGLAATWQRIMDSGGPGEAEARLRRYDGDYRWFLFRVSPLRDQSGAIVKW